MKFKIEKNIKIINELIAYFYKLGTVDVHIDLSSDNENSYKDGNLKISIIREESK